MKETLLVPVVYLLILLLFTAVGLFLFFLYLAVSGFNPAEGLVFKEVFALLPFRLPLILPAAVSLSILVVSLRLHHRGRGKPFISQAVLAVVAFVVLTLVSGALKPLSESMTRETPVSPVIIPDQISIFDQSIVYLEDREGWMLRNLFIKNYRDPSEYFNHYPSAFIEENNIKTRNGRLLASFDTANPVFDRLFHPPDTVAGFFSDIAAAGRRLYAATTEGGMFRLLVFGAFVLFSIAVQVAGRVSRWPLVNTCLALAFYRAFFYVYRITTNNDIREFLGTTFSDGILKILPELVLLAVAAVLFMLTLLGSGKRKTEEVPG